MLSTKNPPPIQSSISLCDLRDLCAMLGLQWLSAIFLAIKPRKSCS